MAINRGLQPSDIDKRLKILRQQVYGGEDKTGYKFQSSAESKPPESSNNITDVAYLRKDLLKITILASLAVSLQLFLFVALRNNIVKLPI